MEGIAGTLRVEDQAAICLLLGCHEKSLVVLDIGFSDGKCTS